MKNDCLNSKLLLALASRVILGSESHKTHDYYLLSDCPGIPRTLQLSSKIHLVTLTKKIIITIGVCTPSSSSVLILCYVCYA
jgi:hypothetical protein